MIAGFTPTSARVAERNRGVATLAAKLIVNGPEPLTETLPGPMFTRLASAASMLLANALGSASQAIGPVVWPLNVSWNVPPVIVPPNVIVWAALVGLLGTLIMLSMSGPRAKSGRLATTVPEASAPTVNVPVKLSPATPSRLPSSRRPAVVVKPCTPLVSVTVYVSGGSRAWALPKGSMFVPTSDVLTKVILALAGSTTSEPWILPTMLPTSVTSACVNLGSAEV